MERQFELEQAFTNFNVGADDDISVLDVEDEEVIDLSVDHYQVLKEEAVAAQRLVVSRNAVNHVKGRPELATFDAARPLTDEKIFRVSGLIDWHSGKPDAVVEALKMGKVRARVSAGMGVGKSTVLPSYIAEQMDHRVLYVTLNANAIDQCGRYIRSRGIGAFRTNWKSSVCAWVCAMTYSDFCAYAALSGRANLFKHFETFIFDEAFVSEPTVRAALKMFTVLHLPTTNLLMCSANIREDDVGKSMTSGSLGGVKVHELISPDEALASGKLITKYLVDRSVVVLPSDERVHDFVDYYDRNGVDVRYMDSATHKVEMHTVSEWLQGDSSTPRVLVVHCSYAIEFNFPIAYLILFPLESRLVFSGDTSHYEEVPMPQSLVDQAVSRVGRGIVREGSAMVMSKQRGPEGKMTLSQKVEEFVLLFQAYIRPRRTKEWEDVYAIFPNGLHPSTAQVIRRINLPAEMVARYLAPDGRIASRYTKAMMVYAKPDCFLSASKHELPEGHDKWIEQPIIGAVSESVTIAVPFDATGELRVILQAISAIAEGKFDVERWRLQDRSSGRDLEASDSEGSEILARSVRRIRRVRSIELPKEPPREVQIQGWAYAADPMSVENGGAGVRRAVMIDKDRYRDAMTGMFSVMGDYIECSPVPGVNELGYETPGVIELPCGEVESPGGSVVCEFSNSLTVAMNTAQMLSVDNVKEIIGLFRIHGSRLVGSRLFDCFGSPWTSLLKSLCSDFVVNAIAGSGLATFAYGMLSCLINRYSYELVTAISKSNIYRPRVLKLFRRSPTVNEVVRAINKGKFDGIAQSDAFIQRVVGLKGWMDLALKVAERNGVFLPLLVSESQRTLPIHPDSDIGNLADGSMVDGSNYVRHIDYGPIKRNSGGEWKRRF